MSTIYDAIIIGGGHNGLVTAAYLARAGRTVLVLERRELVGGCAVTEELWPGFKVSTATYVNSLFRPEIIRDLELKRHGFEMLPRSPSSFTPFPDGRYLLMGPDKEMTHREIAKFSTKDAEALPKYEAMLERVADFLEPTLVQTPPNPWSPAPGNLIQLARLGLALPQAGHRRPEGHRDPHRRRPADPRPLVRVGGAQGDAGHRRDHRRLRRPVDARHGLRALPSRHGRVQRRPRRLGLRPRRHGRAEQRDRRGGPREGRRDPGRTPTCRGSW